MLFGKLVQEDQSHLRQLTETLPQITKGWDVASWQTSCLADKSSNMFSLHHHETTNNFLTSLKKIKIRQKLFLFN